MPSTANPFTHRHFFARAGLTLCALVAAGIFCLAGQASARPEMAGKSADTRFEAMDSDKSGHVSRDEFFTAHPQMKDAAFDSIDKDRDGQISPEEWRAFSMDHGKGDPHEPGGESAGPGKAPALIMPPAQ
ncbi:hypothetical protein LJC59_08555 [Desulfovibrio sp. OttesenSCG-928-A18]|nr:hypothetical protein [Desulfovibrio sp. OttesenSCG-928-A18]